MTGYRSVEKGVMTGYRSVEGRELTIIVNTRDTVEKLENAHGGSDGLHELREDGEQRLERKNRLRYIVIRETFFLSFQGTYESCPAARSTWRAKSM